MRRERRNDKRKDQEGRNVKMRGKEEQNKSKQANAIIGEKR